MPTIDLPDSQLEALEPPIGPLLGRLTAIPNAVVLDPPREGRRGLLDPAQRLLTLDVLVPKPRLPLLGLLVLRVPVRLLQLVGGLSASTFLARILPAPAALLLAKSPVWGLHGRDQSQGGSALERRVRR